MEMYGTTLLWLGMCRWTRRDGMNAAYINVPGMNTFTPSMNV